MVHLPFGNRTLRLEDPRTAEETAQVDGVSWTSPKRDSQYKGILEPQAYYYGSCKPVYCAGFKRNLEGALRNSEGVLFITHQYLLFLHFVTCIVVLNV